MNQYEQGGVFQAPQESGFSEPPRTSGLAISSLVCSLIFCCPLTTIIGPILGLIAFVSIGSNPNRRGKGLAATGIILGLILTTGWVYLGSKGWAFGVQFYELMMSGPKTALVAGSSNDLTGFKEEFYGAGASVSDEEVQNYLDELNNRYGTFADSRLDESAGSFSPTPGQTSMVLLYIIEFENETMSADVELIFTDPQNSNDPFVFKIGFILIHDDDLGALRYPPSPDDTPPPPDEDDASEATDGDSEEPNS